MKKIERIVALVLILLLVIATNVMDNTNFKIVGDSVSNIYEDRLLAYDITYKMHNEVVKRRLALNKNDLANFESETEKFDKKIENLLSDYSKTSMTPKELKRFEILQSQFIKLKTLENEYIATHSSGAVKNELKDIELKTAKIFESLTSLAEIQLTEGKRQLFKSKKAIESSNLLSKIEMITMAIITFIIIFLIIKDPG